MVKNKRKKLKSPEAIRCNTKFLLVITKSNSKNKYHYNIMGVFPPIDFWGTEKELKEFIGKLRKNNSEHSICVKREKNFIEELRDNVYSKYKFNKEMKHGGDKSERQE